MSILLMSSQEDQPDDKNHLDELTRQRFKDNIQYEQFNPINLIDKITATAFLLGIVIGIVLASFLHRYIVHPFGW